MDSPEDIVRYYKKQHKIYDATRSSFLFGRNKLADRVNKNIRANDRVLEIGCGTGYLLNKIKKSNINLYGIDLSPEMLSLAEKKLGNTVELEHTSFLNFTPDEKFDKIIFAYFFTISLNELTNNINKTKSILKKGGSIYVVDFHNYGNGIYKRYMNWHGIEMSPSLTKSLDSNFETTNLNIQKAYLGTWKYFHYEGVYND